MGRFGVVSWLNTTKSTEVFGAAGGQQDATVLRGCVQEHEFREPDDDFSDLYSRNKKYK